MHPHGFLKEPAFEMDRVALVDSLDGAVDSDNTALQLACVHFQKPHWTI